MPTHVSAATAKAGGACTKLNSTSIVGAKKFTCIKSGKKLVWDKGVAVVPVFVRKPQAIIVPELKNVFLLGNKEVSIDSVVTTSHRLVSVSASGACSNGAFANHFTLNMAGICTLTMTQAGDPEYLAAPTVTASFEILKNPQPLPPFSVKDQDLLTSKDMVIEYPNFGSKAPVVITNRSPEVCSIDAAGKKISFLAVGQCTLTFNKAGDDFYEDAKPIDLYFKIFLSSQPGERGNPAGLGKEISKGGLTVTVDAINDEVSGFVCSADLANKGCIDRNGSAIFQSLNNDRYVEIVFAILNNSSKTWIASNIYMQADADHNFPKTTVYTIDSLDGLELEPGDGITGSYFLLLPNNLDPSRTLISYGDGNEATTFYFKAK